MSMLKNKNLNREKILLSPGAGNLRGSRVENNERSVDEFDNGIKSESPVKEKRTAVAGDQLINQLNMQIKKTTQLIPESSFGTQDDASQQYLRMGTQENSFT